MKELRVLTDKEISAAILQLESKHGKCYPEGTSGALHEHPDCIRTAYAWLDAQKKPANITRTISGKHIIEQWGKRYVSSSDVVVAAFLHPEIRGTYPKYNISKSLIYPSRARKDGIGEAGKHLNYGGEHSLWSLRDRFAYSRIETLERGKFVVYSLPYGGVRERTKALKDRNMEINKREFLDQISTN